MNEKGGSVVNKPEILAIDLEGHDRGFFERRGLGITPTTEGQFVGGYGDVSQACQALSKHRG